jgi:hypothetical protein
MATACGGHHRYRLPLAPVRAGAPSRRCARKQPPGELECPFLVAFSDGRSFDVVGAVSPHPPGIRASLLASATAALLCPRRSSTCRAQVRSRSSRVAPQSDQIVGRPKCDDELKDSRSLEPEVARHLVRGWWKQPLERASWKSSKEESILQQMVVTAFEEPNQPHRNDKCENHENSRRGRAEAAFADAIDGCSKPGSAGGAPGARRRRHEVATASHR